MARWALLLPVLFAIVAIRLASQRGAKTTPAPFVEIRPGLWRSNNDFSFVPPPALPVPVAVWLVEGKSSWVLIDTGAAVPAYAPGFKSAMQERLTASKKPLGLVLLTHGHLDHAGNLAWVLDTYPDVPFAFHEAEQPFITGGKQYFELNGDSYQFAAGKYYMGSQNSSMPASRQVVLQGASGDVASYTKAVPKELLKYQHLPGHSPGMVAYIHPSSKSVIAADSITSMSSTWPFTLSGKSKVDIPFQSPTHRFDIMRQSQRTLAKVSGVDKYFPSHDHNEGVSYDELQAYVAQDVAS